LLEHREAAAAIGARMVDAGEARVDHGLAASGSADRAQMAGFGDDGLERFEHLVEEATRLGLQRGFTSAQREVHCDSPSLGSASSFRTMSASTATAPCVPTINGFTSISANACAQVACEV
jgi:hypothetical protein